MKRRSAAVLIALVMLGAPGTARAEWVIAGFLGTAATSRSYLMLTQDATRTAIRFDSVDYQGRSFELPPYYGYRAAYFFRTPGWFGLEAEVIHMKVFAQPEEALPASGTLHGGPVAGSVPLDTVVQRFSLSHGQNMLLANAVLRHPFGERGSDRTARLVATIRLGVGPTLPHVESTVNDVTDERYEIGAVAFQAGGGIELRLWKGLHGLAEYKFTRCRQAVNTAGNSHVETLLTTHHVVFGAAWHF